MLVGTQSVSQPSCSAYEIVQFIELHQQKAWDASCQIITSIQAPDRLPAVQWSAVISVYPGRAIFQAFLQDQLLVYREQLGACTRCDKVHAASMHKTPRESFPCSATSAMDPTELGWLQACSSSSSSRTRDTAAGTSNQKLFLVVLRLIVQPSTFPHNQSHGCNDSGHYVPSRFTETFAVKTWYQLLCTQMPALTLVTSKPSPNVLHVTCSICREQGNSIPVLTCPLFHLPARTHRQVRRTLSLLTNLLS